MSDEPEQPPEQPPSIAAARARRKTKAKKKGRMPAWTPDRGDVPWRFALWLNEIWDLEDDNPFVASERFGRHGDAPLVLIRQDGQRVRWTHQSTLQRPVGLQAVLMSECGIKPLHFTPNETLLIAWAMTQFADLLEDQDPREEVALWWLRYVDTHPVRQVDPDNERQWRSVLLAWQEARSHDEVRHQTSNRETFIGINVHTGVRYVRREDFAEHVRAMVKGLSWPTLNARMAEVGWSQMRVQKRATAAGAPYVAARLYVVPANWPELEDSDELPA